MTMVVFARYLDGGFKMITESIDVSSYCFANFELFPYLLPMSILQATPFQHCSKLDSEKCA